MFNLINWTTFSGPINWNTIILWLNKLYQHLEDMFPTIWYQIYYQIAKISQDWNHFMILDAFSDL